MNKMTWPVAAKGCNMQVPSSLDVSLSKGTDTGTAERSLSKCLQWQYELL